MVTTTGTGTGTETGSGLADWELLELRLGLGHAPLFFLGRNAEKQQRNSKAQAELSRAQSRLENGTFPDGNLPHA